MILTDGAFEKSTGSLTSHEIGGAQEEMTERYLRESGKMTSLLTMTMNRRMGMRRPVREVRVYS